MDGCESHTPRRPSPSIPTRSRTRDDPRHIYYEYRLSSRVEVYAIAWV